MRSLSFFLLVTLGAVGPASVDAQRSGSGSEVPCAVPMEWSIGRIDPRFRLTEDRALQAAREAASRWEEAVDAELFRFTPDAGFPVVFEFDRRQAAVQERGERIRALEAEGRGIESARAELEAAAQRLERAQARYQRELDEYNRMLRAYDADLERLSRERDVPPPVRAELDRRGAELEERGRELRGDQRELNRLSQAVQEDVRRFNQRVERLRREQASFNREFPVVATESGTYDETISTRDGRIVSVERRIRIFQFMSDEELVRVLAHELGHALGLGHAGSEGAIMSEVIASGGGPSATVTATDRRLLLERCPGLGG